MEVDGGQSGFWRGGGVGGGVILSGSELGLGGPLERCEGKGKRSRRNNGEYNEIEVIRGTKAIGVADAKIRGPRIGTSSEHHQRALTKMPFPANVHIE